ncbi:MAG: hypothetical protein NTW19_12960 [Planctomycetota bacterium]|nr:hypothetical protein [Planctomycetota bacterium]
MRYAFGCARPLYARGVHPRVMLGPEDVTRLRTLVRKGDGLKVMTALRGKVRRLVESVLTAPDLIEMLLWKKRKWNEPGILVRMCLDDIALVSVIDDDAEGIEAARRVFATAGDERLAANVGLSATAFDVMHPHLSEEIRTAFAKREIAVMRGQIDRSRKQIYKTPGGNVTLGVALAGLPALLALSGDPGVESLDAERSELLSFYEAVLHAAINVDGYPEEDTGYGTGVTAWLVRAGEMLRRAGIYDPYKECPRFAKFGQAMLHFVQPWGENLANTGDHGADFEDRTFALARLAKETRDPSLLWLLGTLYYTHGMVHPENLLPHHYIEVPLRKGFRTPAAEASLLVLPELKGEKHPSKLKIPTAFRDRGRGLVSFRSGWKPDATFVVFDGSQRSPAGPGHFHDSCGNFSISALGDYFAVDNGRYNNDQTCHNVMLINGKAGRSLEGEWACNYHFGRLTEYAPGPFVDFAAVDSSHQHNCMWAWRRLGLVKGERTPAYVWTVDDVNLANDWAEFWWTLNTSPENTIEIHGQPAPNQSATIKGWRSGNLLDVHFAIPRADSYPKPHTLELSQDVNRAGAYKYFTDMEANARAYPRLTDQLHGALYIRPRLIAKIAGYNGKSMAVMLPRLVGDQPAKVEQVDAVDNSLAMRIEFPKAGVFDTVIWAFEHHILRAQGIEARGDWCVVRRATRGGKVIDFAMGDGTSLKVAGQSILRPGVRPAKAAKAKR